MELNFSNLVKKTKIIKHLCSYFKSVEGGIFETFLGSGVLRDRKTGLTLFLYPGKENFQAQKEYKEYKEYFTSRRFLQEKYLSQKDIDSILYSHIGIEYFSRNDLMNLLEKCKDHFDPNINPGYLELSEKLSSGKDEEFIVGLNKQVQYFDKVVLKYKMSKERWKKLLETNILEKEFDLYEWIIEQNKGE